MTVFVSKFIFNRIKKRRKPKVKIVTLQLCEVKKSGVTRLDLMKHGSGIKGRDDRSSGIEIRIADDLAKISRGFTVGVQKQ
jgi:hypothetical protein